MPPTQLPDAPEGEAEEVLDRVAVDLRGPGPVEVGDGLEAPDAGVLDPALQTPPGPLRLLDVEQPLDGLLAPQVLPVRQEPEEAQGTGAGPEAIIARRLAHGCPPPPPRSRPFLPLRRPPGNPDALRSPGGPSGNAGAGPADGRCFAARSDCAGSVAPPHGGSPGAPPRSTPASSSAARDRNASRPPPARDSARTGRAGNSPGSPRPARRAGRAGDGVADSLREARVSPRRPRGPRTSNSRAPPRTCRPHGSIRTSCGGPSREPEPGNQAQRTRATFSLSWRTSVRRMKDTNRTRTPESRGNRPPPIL